MMEKNMQNSLIQKERFLHLKTPLALNELVLTHVTVQERISSYFSITLNILSADTHIEPERLINNPVTIAINSYHDKAPRYFHGLIRTFTTGPLDHGHRFYYATAMPWLGQLNYTNDYRIFQNKTVIDITKEIFTEFNLHNYDFSLLTQSYKKRDYCVQYAETTSHFLERIWSEEGIFYFFKHEKDKHTLILGDKSFILKKCVGDSVQFSAGSNKGHCITQWNRSHQFYSGKIEQNDFNYESPEAQLLTTQTGNAKLSAAQVFSLYHYPGGHQTHSDGKKMAQYHFEEQEARHDVAYGQSNYSEFMTGGVFTFSNPPSTSDADDYVISAVVHNAIDQSYLNTGAQSYSNEFECIPVKNSFRPTVSSKPRIYGPQTAMVVGPIEEEIYSDSYGRVKVQFHWDRTGKKDDNSSYWIRVAQLFAGQQWGALFLPRIGQEVIVQFLDGDPDKPVIIGTVYNASNLPPYDLPAQQTRSGIRTCSSKNGSKTECNELYFEDKCGNEEIYLHAQRDFNRIVEANETVFITKGNHKMCVQAGKSILEAKQEIELKVGNNSIRIDQTAIYINGQQVKINQA